MSTKTRSLFVFLPVAIALALSALLIGCEGDSNNDKSGAREHFDNNPYVSEPREEPSAHQLTVAPEIFVVSYTGQQVVFTATGGEGDYRWSVTWPNRGGIQARQGNQAVYTVGLVAENSVRVQDNSGHYGIGYIQTVSSSNQNQLTVSPDSVTLKGSGEMYASFTAVGGQGPYHWISGNTKMGTVHYTAENSHVASYVSIPGAFGQNLVTVKDAEGRTASGKVIQTLE